METKLYLITKKAKEDKKCKFNNLMHLINPTTLKECFYMLKRNKASGIDKVTMEEYESKLKINIEDLISRMKRMSYKPQAVRRVYIPKEKGKTRPLGIPTVEDKLTQMAFTRILEAIYEVDFVDFSYGFRKRRNTHQALAHINKTILCKPVNYIIDADIKGFFDNVEHQWMKRCLEERISDKKFIRYIVRFLKSGVMEDGKINKTYKGTPQGGVISPVLANIYLHYVLDLWFEKIVKKQCQGYTDMVRYCDDFVICVQHKEDAKRIIDMLKDRLKKFGLEVAEDKTRIVRFGRKANDNIANTQKPETFNFLGFTHYCSKTRKNKFKVARKTEKKRYQKALRKVKDFLKINRSKLKQQELWNMMSLVLRGHYQYYGVSDNFKMISRFKYDVQMLLFKWINKKSQRKKYTWDSYYKYINKYPLPSPKIYHNLYKIAFQRE